MEISNPRRILAVSLADSAHHLANVIKDLTGTAPPPSTTPLPDDTTIESNDQDPAPPTLAGTTHHLPLSTPYYTASVPVWLDLISSSPSPSSEPGSSPASTSPAAEWAASFLAPEAREVLGVLGGVVVVFALPSPSSGAPQGGAVAEDGGDAKELIRSVGKVVREGLGGWGWDGVGLAVGVGGPGVDAAALEEWEEVCGEAGMEFVHLLKAGVRKGGDKEEDGKRNEFGEKVGIARVLEALEANDWSGDGGEGEGWEEGREEGGKEEEDAEFDPESMGFGFDREDFVGLRKAIWGGGGDGHEGGAGGEGKEEEFGDEDVQKLEKMMLKLQAIRDASAGLPEEQRKRMAARAVGEVMKEL
ncbi:hypothetical protein C8A05DRAFT_35122 [Staphylotrichum tortipilum]|uniref:Alpha and gamma adaptin binding protein p34 n=1 Tax=Staphylotrichum tortipilum TaxID=2831512 RepID=A0AAN6RT62_9PEZI|nr:hypothetical protein C8A05DRAFT_35122 [Staphylotrichum longicolle]